MKVMTVINPAIAKKNPDDYHATSYKGNIWYSQLGNHKYKGNGISQKGMIEIGESQIKILKGGYPHLTFNLMEIRFLCKGYYICRTDPYLKHQNQYHSNKEKIWMENHFTRFFKDTPEVTKSDCAVLITTFAKYNISEGIIICSKSEIEQVVSAITGANARAISAVPEGGLELKKLPLAPDHEGFTVYIATAGINDDINNEAATKVDIMTYVSGIKYIKTKEYLFMYKELVDQDTLQLQIFWTIEYKNLAKDLKAHNIESKCCFGAKTGSNLFHICLYTNKRCVYDKGTLYARIKFEVQQLVSSTTNLQALH